MSDEQKQEEKSLRAGQFWIKGTVESYGPVTRGSYTANVLRVFVPNERNANYPDTFFIKVFDKSADKVTAQVGDEVECKCYVSSRLNRANDGAFPDFALAFCKVLRASTETQPASSLHDFRTGVRVPGVPDISFSDKVRRET